MRRFSQKMGLGAAALATLLVWTAMADAARIKDITDVRGFRHNELIGYGLIIGLGGTGDTYNKAAFTIQALVSLLNRQGIRIPPEKFNTVQIKNIASVMVTARLPAFARRGNKIDITVSSIGDAKSLQGGTLLLTPLRAVDGKVYALAQGGISIGGFEADSQSNSVRKNHTTVGRIAGGAVLEKDVEYDYANETEIVFNLKNADFTTAHRMVEVINTDLRGIYASAVDPRTVRVGVPDLFKRQFVELMARLEILEVQTDSTAKVVMNERTGTIIIGSNVRISTMALSHGALTIRVETQKEVSQPNPFGGGETAVAENSQIVVEEEDARLIVVPEGVSLAEVVNGLNSLGVTPRDLISILQAIKASGALQAELELM